MKVLTINGTELEVPQAVTTVRELLTHLELDRKVVIVELNRNILEKNRRTPKPCFPMETGSKSYILWEADKHVNYRTLSV